MKRHEGFERRARQMPGFVGTESSLAQSELVAAQETNNEIRSPEPLWIVAVPSDRRYCYRSSAERLHNTRLARDVGRARDANTLGRKPQHELFAHARCRRARFELEAVALPSMPGERRERMHIGVADFCSHQLGHLTRYIGVGRHNNLARRPSNRKLREGVRPCLHCIERWPCPNAEVHQREAASAPRYGALAASRLFQYCDSARQQGGRPGFGGPPPPRPANHCREGKHHATPSRSPLPPKSMCG